MEKEGNFFSFSLILSKAKLSQARRVMKPSEREGNRALMWQLTNFLLAASRQELFPPPTPPQVPCFPPRLI